MAESMVKAILYPIFFSSKFYVQKIGQVKYVGQEISQVNCQVKYMVKNILNKFSVNYFCFWYLKLRFGYFLVNYVLTKYKATCTSNLPGWYLETYPSA